MLPDSFGDKVAEEFEQELNSGELDWNIKFGMAQIVSDVETTSR